MIWKRFGGWCAHWYHGERQVCRTQQGKFLRAFDPRLAHLKEPKPAELAPNGLPYGRVCAHCLKVYHRTAKGAE